MFFFEYENEPVKNYYNKTAINEFSILGLFGKENVTLKFDKTVNIFIGENGLGKTTILNCMYFLLHGEYEKLVSIPFSQIIMRFKDNKEYIISKADILSFVDDSSSNKRYRYREIYPYIEEIVNQYSNNIAIIHDEDIQDIIVMHLAKRIGIPYPQARMAVLSYISNFDYNLKGNAKRIKELREKISNSVSERIIYLTTYRRIEKDYSEYFNIEKERFRSVEADMLIRFGMKDVTKSINSILEIISDKTNQGFNKMTGILLSKYARSSFNERNRRKTIDISLLKIVLDRLGKQIDDEDKKNILELVESKRIYQSEHQYLQDLIDELINSYNRLKIYDEKITGFTDTCNKYLNNKSFVYNPSEITLKLFSKDDNSELELSMLSSGEKQIVSLFSRLYLESERKCILLIDEPELSISMRWQKMILPDIVRSNNCNLLITVTHSPFIFDNEFDNDAHDMWYCFNNRSVE